MNSEEILREFLLRSTQMSLAEATYIASRFQEKKLARNDFFLNAGQTSNEYLFLVKGVIRSYAIDPEGQEITTGFYCQHEMVFEVTSFFNRSKSCESFKALTDCIGMALTFEQLNTLFHEMPAFRELGRAMLVKGFSALKVRMLGTITETAEQRYLDLITHRQEVIHNAPLKTIASYLGITDTSLSRIRKEIANNRL